MTDPKTDPAAHTRDADCAPFLDERDVCTVCGVSHTGGCATCSGQGFHEAGCPGLTPDAAALLVGAGDRERAAWSAYTDHQAGCPTCARTARTTTLLGPRCPEGERLFDTWLEL